MVLITFGLPVRGEEAEQAMIAAIASMDLSRIAVVGTSCSGKTTLAGQLAATLKCPHIELDAIFWGPNWTMMPESEFRVAVEKASQGPRWVVDGNYSPVRDLVWSRATLVVWLNYPFRLVFWRALRRTVSRVISKEELFSGNRETFRAAFLSRESLLWWIITTHRRRRRKYRELLEGKTFPDLGGVELQGPKETQEFLQSVIVASKPGSE
jgi:adenylate kinase family enzyme